ncbi:peptidase S41 [Bacteroidia bacterium]|nr:peptidase S41 [Bacteroidia bacterium]
MNKRIYLLLLLGAWLGACVIDEPVKNDNSANKWIEETMRQYYLWEDEIPDAAKLDHTLEPEEFFQSMLSAKDGKARYHYSTINKTKGATKSYMGEDNTFGFEYQYFSIMGEGNQTRYYALLVLYVLPESPASEKGLKRGDWILQINRNPVPANAAALLEALDTTTPAEVVFGLNSSLPQSLAVTQEMALTPRMVVDNPVFADTTFSYEGQKIAYLLFNHFTDGVTDNDETFHDSMREAFARFQANNPTDFILDLRYNPGGLVKTAQLLATMLAPATALDDVFCHFIYNQKLQHTRESLFLDTKYMLQGNTPGANLDLKRLFVITSNRTASASEAVINGLAPYMNGQIILVGGTTEGKNVASSTFSNESLGWEIHPIISRISNKEEFSDYSSGFPPTYPCEEMRQETFFELGDTREFMLKQVLDFIAHGTPIRDGVSSLRSSGSLRLVPGYSSIERRSSMTK